MIASPGGVVTSRMHARQALERSGRLLRLLVASAIALACLLALGSPPVAVSSPTPAVVVGLFGSPGAGTGNGQFTIPRGIAVDPTSLDNDIYVVDSAGRVEKFDPSGNFISTFGTAGSQGGQLSGPQGAATDSSGDVFVSDPGNNRVDEFTSSGAFVMAFGDDVDSNPSAANPNVCPAVDSTSCKAGATGSGAGQFASGIGFLAIDQSTGDIYVADPGNHRIDVFNSSGTFVMALGDDVDKTSGGNVCTAASSDTCQAGATGSSGAAFAGGSPTRIAVDSNGNVYAVDAGNDRVLKLDSSGDITSFASGEFSSSTLQPVDIAVDQTPSANDVYVEATCASSTPCPTEAANSERRVLEFDAEGDLIVTDGAGAGIQTVGSNTGLAYDPGTGNIYMSSALVSPAPLRGVFILNSTPVPPVPATSAATNVGGTTATLNGTVNPTGLSTGYHFQYSTDDATWTNIPASDVNVVNQTTPETESEWDVGNGTSPLSVSQNVTGLEANTTYYFRLVATKLFDAGSATTGSGANPPTSDPTFTTGPSAPVVSGLSTSAVTDTEATLNAEINPENSSTTYQFEYGTADCASNPCTDVPASPVTIGSQGANVLESQHITGLEPATTYHFLVVATNSTGTTQSSDTAFTTFPSVTSSSGLPDGRAYEQVSPVDTNGGDVAEENFLSNGIEGGQGQAVSSASGDAVVYYANTEFAGTQGGNLEPTYLATRSSDGWSTQSTSGTFAPTESNSELPYSQLEGLSPDLSLAAIANPNPPQGPGAPELDQFQLNLYIRNNSNGLWQILTNVPPPTSAVAVPVFAGASADWSHVIFEENAALTPNAPSGVTNLYEWVGNKLSLAGEIPPPMATSCGGAGPACTPAAEGSVAGEGTANGVNLINNAISSDGSEVFFTASSAGEPGQLYVNENGISTMWLSASQKTNGSGPGGTDRNGTKAAEFWGASTDGSEVFFTSPSELTNDANTGSTDQGNDLYEWVADGTGSCNTVGGCLTDITVDTTGNGADVLGVTGISDDGSYVYFVAEGNLAGMATSGQPNLYVNEPVTTPLPADCVLAAPGTQTCFIAKLASTGGNSNEGDLADWSNSAALGTQGAPEVTPNGQHLLFTSWASQPGYDNTDANTGKADAEVYEYDADTSRLTCVSCDPSGEQPVGPASLPQEWEPLLRPRAISNDGTRVFFTSPDELLPQATNGQQNVYEWEADGSGSCDSSADQGGCLFLISTGQCACNSTLSGISPSGDDVFFATAQQLVGQAEPGLVALYDARVGGGIPSQNPAGAPAPCSGEACRGPGSAAPGVPSIGSVSFNGPGNPLFGATTAKVKISKKTVHGSTFTLSVNVPASGRISGKGSDLKTVNKSVSRAGTYKLKFTLTAKAKRTLKRKHKLKVTVRVIYTPSGGTPSSATVAVTLKA